MKPASLHLTLADHALAPTPGGGTPRVEAEGELTAWGPGLRPDPAPAQPLIKAAAEIRAVMTLVRVALHPVGADRVVDEADIGVGTGIRLLQALNDEARNERAELVVGLVERSAGAVPGGPSRAS
jgi:hypothetical protein